MSDTKKTPTFIYPSEMADTSWWNDAYIPDLPTGNQWEPKRCDCGCWVTYGENCPIEFHSPWCSLVRSN